MNSNQALIRDGYRCVVTGRYDEKMTAKNKELASMAIESGIPPAVTQCAHIFSESTNVNIAPESGKVSHPFSSFS